MGKPICALAKAPCPKTNDPEAPVFCPYWSNNLPDTLLDGSFRLSIGNPLVGCSVPLIFRYAISGIVESDHAHAAANQARDAAIKVEAELTSNENKLRGTLLPLLLESVGFAGGLGQLNSLSPAGERPKLLDVGDDCLSTDGVVTEVADR